MTSSTKPDLVEHVKLAQEAAAAEFHRQQKEVQHSVLAMKGETLPTMRARAAIIATLQWARDNVSEKMRTAGADQVEDSIDYPTFAEDTTIVHCEPAAVDSFRAMISALLQEIGGDP